MNLNEFGKLQLESTEYSSFSISTPNFVTASIPNLTFHKIVADPRKFSKFKSLVDNVQTSLYESFIEERMFPKLTEEKKNKIESLARRFTQNSLAGYIIESGRDYLVFVLDVDKNLKILKGVKPSIKENEARFNLYNYHYGNICEILEGKLHAIQAQFDNRAYV